jgi:hypothetical protein
MKVYNQSTAFYADSSSWISQSALNFDPQEGPASFIMEEIGVEHSKDQMLAHWQSFRASLWAS